MDATQIIEQADQQLAAFRHRRALDSLMRIEAKPRVDAIDAFEAEIASEQEEDREAATIKAMIDDHKGGCHSWLGIGPQMECPFCLR